MIVDGVRKGLCETDMYVNAWGNGKCKHLHLDASFQALSDCLRDSLPQRVLDSSYTDERQVSGKRFIRDLKCGKYELA